MSRTSSLRNVSLPAAVISTVSGAGEVQFAGMNLGAGGCTVSGADLAGQQRAVHVAAAVADDAVGRQPVARRDGHRHAGLEVARRHVAACCRPRSITVAPSAESETSCAMAERACARIRWSR